MEEEGRERIVSGYYDGMVIVLLLSLDHKRSIEGEEDVQRNSTSWESTRV